MAYTDAVEQVDAGAPLNTFPFTAWPAPAVVVVAVAVEGEEKEPRTPPTSRRRPRRWNTSPAFAPDPRAGADDVR
jgi:hypothetical protein